MNDTKIRKTSDSWEFDAKRFYPPYSISSSCPKCLKPYKQNMRFSYPKIDKPAKYTLYCEDCDHEWQINIVIELTIKIIPD